MLPDELRQIGDLNLAEFHRETIRSIRGEIAECSGMLMFASSLQQPSPGTVNGTIRLNPSLPPDHALSIASRFFTELGHGFTLIIRTGDDDLEEAAVDAGLVLAHQEPAMALIDLAPADPIPAGCEIRQVNNSETLLDFKNVAKEGFGQTENDLRAVNLLLSQQAMLVGVNRAGFIAYKDGAPAATAMTLVSHGAAFIGWVGTKSAYRRQGLGTAVTRSAIEAGFDRGARIASLQSSAMAYSMYGRLGFTEVGRYREYTAQPNTFTLRDNDKAQFHGS